ncbi:hypothetical protein XM53_18000 [Roseovarius atlanticus]|uniref:Uncharacterized protein n=1 Tax=Roseovarius atlanticus TaxID=1641875 RepID=A0A0T5NQM3_9RHOB|nr:hypothetical protein XM53_18000 [Roseovarius atlanticus]
MRFALVQTDLGAALHVSVKEPFDDEEGALDAADFAKRHGQLVLARIGGELREQLTGWHSAGHHGGRGAQDAGPVLDDKTLADLAADQAAQLIRC